MNKNEIIVSEYHWTSIVKLAVYYSYKALLFLFFAWVVVKGKDLLIQLLILGLIAALFYLLYTQVYQGGIVKKIIIRPEHLEVIYWFKGGEIIDYINIKAIMNLRERAKDGSAIGRLKQEIVLLNNDVIDYNENEFINYDQMKNAIWNYRLAAFDKLKSEPCNDTV